MAKTKLDPNAWLKEIGFSDTEIADLAPKLAPKIDAIGEHVMRQSDYDRMMNEGKAEITTAQQTLNDANERLNREMAEWAIVQAEGGAQTEQMRKDVEAAKLAAFKARQAIERLGQQHQIDVTQVLSEVTQVAPMTIPAATVPVTPAAPDLKNYVTAEDYRSTIGQLGNMALHLPAQLLSIAGEHQTLYGAPIDTRTITAEIEKRASTRGNQKSLDPRQVWDELYNVSAKRTEVAEATQTKLLADAESRGYEKGRSEIAIPGNTSVPGKHSSPVLGGQRQSLVNRPQPGQTVATAASAFRSGKYRHGTQSTT